jgi:hypothetical protein
MELLPRPRADGPASDDDAVDVLALFGVLRRRKWFVLTVAAAGALGGLLIGLWRLAQADASWRCACLRRCSSSFCELAAAFAPGTAACRRDLEPRGLQVERPMAAQGARWRSQGGMP